MKPSMYDATYCAKLTFFICSAMVSLPLATKFNAKIKFIHKFCRFIVSEIELGQHLLSVA